MSATLAALPSGSTRAGIYINSTTNSTISGNTADHNSSHGILLTNGSNDNLVSGNIAFANAEGWQRNATGIKLDASNNNTILHNITFANEDTGLNIYTGSSGNFLIGNVTYGNGDHGIDFNASPNNTVIGNTVQGNVTAGINFEGASAPGSGGATVANNLMVDNGLRFQVGGGTAAGQPGNMRFDANSLVGNALDYNIFYLNSGTALIQWNGASYSTLAAFQGAVPGQEIHGLEADPFFSAPAAIAQRPAAAPFNVAVNVGDYHLTAGSPAIDSANSDAINETTLDIEGNARVDDPSTADSGVGTRTYDDRGAYEFQPAPQEAGHGQQGNGRGQQGNGRGQQGNGRGQQGNGRGRKEMAEVSKEMAEIEASKEMARAADESGLAKSKPDNAIDHYYECLEESPEVYAIAGTADINGRRHRRAAPPLDAVSIRIYYSPATP